LLWVDVYACGLYLKTPETNSNLIVDKDVTMIVRGVSLYINYKKIGTVGGLEFKKAILNIWLSNKPVDKSLKLELLDGAQEFLKN